MSRFSPTQRSSAKPGGLGGLAAALQQGVEGFQAQRDRQEGQRNRAFAQDVQRGGLLERGISIDTPEEPEGFGSAFARALNGAPAPQPARPPAPGAFMVDAGDFEKVDPKTGLPAMPVMRSGNVAFDPNVPLQREMASATAKGKLGLSLAKENRDQLQSEFGPAVEAEGGRPEAGRLPNAGGWLAPFTSALQYTAPNAGNPGGRFNRKTGEWEPIQGTNPIPRATGTGNRVAVKVQQDLKDISYGLDGIERAIGLVEDNPTAFGLKNMLGPTITDRLDPGGIQARTAVENIVSAIRHSLYGAALTRPEIQRALTNLPDVKNDPQGAIVRLRELAVKLEQERRAIEGSMGETNVLSNNPPSPTAPRPSRAVPNSPDDY